MSWIYETSAEATDGSGLITKKIVAEQFNDQVALLVEQKNPKQTSSQWLLHMSPEEADALGRILIATALDAKTRRDREAW